ncbi:hypothetical protein HAX54_018514, partial [Datura stramonium]|nr:hypothetical protein [Datura stramonium]
FTRSSFALGASHLPSLGCDKLFPSTDMKELKGKAPFQDRHESFEGDMNASWQSHSCL